MTAFGCSLDADASDQPKAIFGQASFDFGKTVQGTLIEHEFLVTNQGTAPLRIEKITMTPPLLATRIPGEIAPGSAAAIRTRLDTSQLQGSYSGEMVAYLNDQALPQAILTLEGLVVTPIEIAPMPAFFVAGQRGRGGERSVEIINHEPQPLAIEDVTHATDSFTTRIETVRPGQHYRLTLALRPEGPGGKRTETIVLKTSSPTTPTLKIAAHTYLRERVYAFPDAVDLGALRLPDIQARPELLEQLAQTLMVYQTAGSDFRISSVDTDLPALKLRYERGSHKDRYQITATLSAKELQAGPLTGSIRIRTNDPECPLVVVPVMGVIL